MSIANTTVPVSHNRPLHRRAGFGERTDSAEVMRSIGRGIAAVLLALTAVISVAGTVTVIVERLGFAPVLSPSMVPAFAPGDLVVTRPKASTDIKIGDVLSLPIPDSAGEHYVHRIIEVTHTDGAVVVRTKGDANPAADAFRLRI